MKLTVDTAKPFADLGDLYGIFFEDLNHAADGGLYAELIQNRAFEFDPIDNPAYHHLTGWERIGEEDEVGLKIVTGNPVSQKNPHYLAMDILKAGKDAGISNAGFHDGIYLEAGASYDFSCWAKREQEPEEPLVVSLRDENGMVLAEKEFCVSAVWEKYECVLTAPHAVDRARLAVTAKGKGRVYLDFVSLFPQDTYKGRKGGLRRDLCELLEAMHPKFMRFPGGCLTHDGALDPDARDAQYRWKNTVGRIEDRPARRSNWGYHQTLGLGFYELFLLCEDIGAKPLPVLSPGYDPHHHREAPLDGMQYFIDEALDLVEFANGSPDTKWGGLRAQMGHQEPFGMEYLGIGNEEVGEPFYARYKIVADAVREKYPEIKLIGTGSPFAAGSEYERGWRHAREDGADYVDEHYYMSPEWFLANQHRYDDFSENGPKVFLGEYASWGNTWYNALCEASYMLGLERNARKVGLACYAPMLCNADYVNWKPDMIWFDNHRSFGTANYYVQKLFMENQGREALSCAISGQPVSHCHAPGRIAGRLGLAGDSSVVSYRDILLKNEETGEEIRFPDAVVTINGKEAALGRTDWEHYSLSMKATEQKGTKGFRIYFGSKDVKNRFCWSFGGWQNQDTSVTETIHGRGSELSQCLAGVERGREYDLKLCVDGRRIRTYIDGKPFHDVEAKPAVIEPLYAAAARDDNGDILIKAVNVSGKRRRVKLELKGLSEGTCPAEVTVMAGWDKNAENSFEHPELIVPETTKTEITNGAEWEFEKESVTFFRLKG